MHGSAAIGAPEVAQKACLLEGLTHLLAVTPGDFAVILHSDPDCANLVWRDFRAVDPTRFFCTNLTEGDVLSGTSGRVLAEAIREVGAGASPATIVVIGSCVASMVSDDIAGIAAAEARRVKAGIVAVPCEAFRLHGQASILDLFSSIMWGMARSGKKTRKSPRSVSLLGYPPDGGEAARLVASYGGRVVASPATGDPPEAWSRLAAASLNVVSDSRLFSRLLADMERHLGTPWVELEPPLGLASTRAFHSGIAERLGLSARARPAIRKAAAPASRAVGAARRALAGKRMGYHVAGRKDFSLHVVVREGLSGVGMLRELGMDVHLLFQGSAEGRSGDRIRAMLEGYGLDVRFTPLPDRPSLGRAIRDLGLDAVYCSDSLREEVAAAGVPLVPLGSLEPGFEGAARTAARIRAILAGREQRP